jgi:shikimate kinase
MYNNRKDLYQSAADYIILVDNKSINEIVFEIRDIYDKINY